jgi:uncharacterized protein HemY
LGQVSSPLRGTAATDGEKAKQAKRYGPRHFPFMNLGQIYLRQWRWWEALHEFEGAVRLAPGDHHAAKMLHRLRARRN